MDNLVFNVNGGTQEQLERVISLWYINDGYTTEIEKKMTFEGYYLDPKKGFILLKSVYGEKGATKFPVPVSLEIAVGMVYAWLESDEAKKIPLGGWDLNCDHDGSNELGWRVYVEDWGHVTTSDNKSFNFGAVMITPAYLWYGK